MGSWTEFETACKANPTKHGVPAIQWKEASDILPLVSYPVLQTPKASAAPVPAAPVPAAVPAPVPAAVPAVPAVPAVAAKAAKTVDPVDPLRIGMEQRDLMYSMAGPAQRTAMECEEARRLEEALPLLYRSQGGRSRGWTLSGLEPMLKPRCATGTDPKALRAAKAIFNWDLEDKGSSAFFDFVCVAKQIRVAVWNSSKKIITLYPAADQPQTAPLPLYHLNEGGSPRQDTMDGPALIKYANTVGWTLAPPSSVLKALTHLTLTELESVGKQLGAPDTTDLKKTERIAALGAFKVKQRLLS